MGQPSRLQSGSSLRLRTFFRAAEKEAVEVRKGLRHLPQPTSWTPGFMEDALKLTDLIEQLARSGQKCSAADAMVFAELVEVFLDELTAKLQSLLAS